MVSITKKNKKAWATFSIKPGQGESITICGEWSDWKDEPMKIKKNGEFYITKVLSCGKDYQFGYKVNGNEWRCDSTLACVNSPFASQNSVLKI